MTKFQRDVLGRFAAMGCASSRHEVFGSTPLTGGLDAAVHALCGLDLLVAVPTAESADAHGGTRYRVPTLGFVALGLATRYQPVPSKPKVLTRPVLSLPSRN